MRLLAQYRYYVKMQSSAISTLENGFTDSLVASIPRIHGSPIWASSSRSPGVSHPNVTMSTPCTLPFHHFPPAHKIPGRVILSQGSICLSLGLIMSLSLQSTLPVYVSLSHGISAKYFVSKSQYLMVSQRSILPIPRSHYVMVTGEVFCLCLCHIMSGISMKYFVCPKDSLC